MKRFLALLILLFVFALLLTPARAGILIGSLTTITTAQTNSPTFVTNNAYISIPQVTISNNGLSATNSYTGCFRWSLDGTTFFTNNTPIFNPSVTNAGSVTIAPQVVTVPVYVQMLAITNPAAVGAIQLGVTSP